MCASVGVKKRVDGDVHPIIIVYFLSAAFFSLDFRRRCSQPRWPECWLPATSPGKLQWPALFLALWPVNGEEKIFRRMGD